ncbi:uncharacterized protein LOC113562946 [Ooceraea biroi]|uniref:Uncharacterized protein n=1 Tax=Ooceraea biroi TaxID=2015173 RepID=A0A026X2X2_OOCBI|nr:uncharacterized protein LOC113562946 [Ooceraea biroi]EZA62376.1 hypothetical protein X777_03411 [Ooceraea biroi]
MRLFDCSLCLTTLNRRRSSRRRSCDTTDPLVMTKRPATRRRRRYRRPESSQGVTSSRSSTRFLNVMRTLGMRTSSTKLETPKSRKLLADEVRSRRVGIPGTLNGVHLRGRRKHSVETSVGNDTGQEGADLAGRRTGELEREYHEHLEALKFLIDPPPCFRNTETQQNFENKLNSLDLRLMNTVAIPNEIPMANGYRDASMRGLNRFCRSWGSIRENGVPKDLGRSYVDTLDRTMIDLFARAPILKSRQGEQVPARENKTVRFKDEVERTETCVGQGLRREGEGCEAEGVGTDNRVKMEILKEGPDVRRDVVGTPQGSSNVPDVETRNGR